MTQPITNDAPTEAATKRGIQHVLWVNAVAISAVLVVLAVVVGAAYAVRDHDLEAQIVRNRVLAAEQARINASQARLLRSQRATIRYLCQVTLLVDVNVKQEGAFLRLLLKNPTIGGALGPNERELLLSREATLQAVQLELSSQRARRACGGF